MSESADEAASGSSEVEIVPGISFDWPDGFTMLEAVIVVKCIDSDGNVGYLARQTDDLNAVEALGMVQFTDAMLRSKLVTATWLSVDDDDD